MRWALALALLLVGCGDGSSLTRDDLRASAGPLSADSEACALGVARAVCELRLGCSGEPATSCARDEGTAFRGLTCSCTKEQIAACSADTLGMVCSPTETFGACGGCFQ